MFIKLLNRSLLFLLMWIGLLQSNPLPVPQAFISELAFDSTGSWTLEINFQFSTPFHRQQYDSICLVSSHGRSFLKLDHIADGAVFIILTSDSLQSPLSIVREGDCIKVYSYTPISGGGFVDSVAFGNFPGSNITKIPSGYSLCRLGYSLYCKDKSPTMGLPNDTVGTCGILQGHIVDKNNRAITKGQLRFDDTLALDGSGNYTTKIFARKVKWDKIEMFTAPFTSKYEYIDTLSMDIDPDTVITKDIRFTDYIVTVRRDYSAPSGDYQVRNYPNPFNSSTTFKITIPDGDKNNGGSLHIVTVKGEEVAVLPLANSSTVAWDGKNSRGVTVSSGVYYYRLILDNSIHANGSVIFLK